MNIRAVRTKIKSVGSVKKITQAMQLISAIKMRKAQQKALESQPYQDLIKKSIHKITKKIEKNASKLLIPAPASANRDLAIVITSNKGLAGAFNINLVRLLDRNINIKNTDLITSGKKGSLILNSMGANIIADFSSDFPFDNISAIFNLALKKFFDGEYRTVSIYYNKFISSLKYEPLKEVLLPFVFPGEDGAEKQVNYNYLIEPSPEEVIDQLLKSYIEEKIRYAMIQNEAGEHSARMIAMKNATDNASEVIYNLTLLRNQLRQQKITYELLDMITAKESVENL